MAAVSSSRDEFQRKIRTLVRGMTTLFAKSKLLNPLRYPTFSVFLVSHKLMRWCVPFFLLGLLISSALMSHQVFFLALLLMQIAFYGLAALSHYQRGGSAARSFAGKTAMYFTLVNVAIMVAWIRYLSGVRQEIWTPSKRSL